MTVRTRVAPSPTGDPHVVTGVPENHIIRALFEGLAVKNPVTLEPEPGVAERWEFSDEGRIITFYLNSEAKWSNGCLLYTSPSPRDRTRSRMPSSA